MDELLTGLVPGLPDELRSAILERAEGVPLYAVETVRMLLDRGLLAREGDVYRPTGPIETLEVPETLHALIAARLDGLTPEERRLVQDGAVLGKTFTKQGLTALTGLARRELEPLLTSLVRKEVLSVQADPLSPSAASTPSSRTSSSASPTRRSRRRSGRRSTSPRPSSSLSLPGGDEDEIVEVVAAHYLDALEAAPDAPDAGEIRDERARDARPRRRTGGVARRDAEAQRAFERAAELDGRAARAGGARRAGRHDGLYGARGEEAKLCFERSIALFEGAEATHPARASRHGSPSSCGTRTARGGTRAYEPVVRGPLRDEPDADLAALAAQLGRFLFFGGTRIAWSASRLRSSWPRASRSRSALAGVDTKAILLVAHGRKLEGLALLRYALGSRSSTTSPRPLSAPTSTSPTR